MNVISNNRKAILQTYKSAYQLYLDSTKNHLFTPDLRIEVFFMLLVQYPKSNYRLIEAIESKEITWMDIIKFINTNLSEYLYQVGLCYPSEEMTYVHIPSTYYSEFLEWTDIYHNDVKRLLTKCINTRLTRHERNVLRMEYYKLLGKYLIRTRWHLRHVNKDFSNMHQTINPSTKLQKHMYEQFHRYRFELLMLYCMFNRFDDCELEMEHRDIYPSIRIYP